MHSRTIAGTPEKYGIGVAGDQVCCRSMTVNDLMKKKLHSRLLALLLGAIGRYERGSWHRCERSIAYGTAPRSVTWQVAMRRFPRGSRLLGRSPLQNLFADQQPARTAQRIKT